MVPYEMCWVDLWEVCLLRIEWEAWPFTDSGMQSIGKAPSSFQAMRIRTHNL